MHFKCLALCLLIMLAGCKPAYRVAGREAPPESKVPASQYLAYSHSMKIDVAEDKIRAAFDAGQAACRAAAADLCAILESEIRSGKEASATLKFRARPAGIAKLRTVFSGQGDVTEQATVAEDLAGPITDNEKKLSMLKEYRAKLETLQGRASSDVDALIKVTRELSEVQAELETIAGTQAQLKERVDTEILTVDITAGYRGASFKPIAHAFSEFGAHLSEGTATAITGAAVLIPWLIVIGLGTWIGRALLRRRRRKQSAA